MKKPNVDVLCVRYVMCVVVEEGAPEETAIAVI